MTAKFTPGPWVAVGAWVEHTNDNVADICNCDPDAVGQSHLGRSDDEVCANARLIAAAPDMLAALKTLVITRSSRQAIPEALAAIAKATGRVYERT